MKLDARNLSKLKARSKPYEVMDDALPGFGVRVNPPTTRNPQGKRTWFVRYRPGGRETNPVRVSIGELGVKWTPAKARNEALRLLGQVKDGQYPHEKREAAREERGEPTVAALLERYLDTHVKAMCAERSHEEMSGVVERHVSKSPLSKLRISKVERQDVEALVHAMKDKPATANKALTILRAAYTKAIDWGLVKHNPTVGIKKYKEQKKERYLTDDEYATLMSVMDDAERTPERTKGSVNKQAVRLLKFLTFTGLRETAGGRMLRPEQLDLERKRLWLVDKDGERDWIYLTDDAATLLEKHLEEHPGQLYVFQTSKGKPFATVQRAWETLRERAGLDGADGKPVVRLHDLRHSYVSRVCRQGVPLEVAGRLVGHKSPQTTRRYRHLADSEIETALAKLNASSVVEPAKEAPQRRRRSS